jgi:arylsulfatase A-like enzyme
MMNSTLFKGFQIFGKPSICFYLSLCLVITSCSGGSGGSSSSAPSNDSPTPNILFIVMDDVGIDQMKFAGYGGLTPANTPVMDAIISQGVTFTNTWALPECSPSRAMYFNGRYPIRTSINSALLALDLANSQMNPDEVTTPRVLRNAGYKSALFGKAHIAGSPSGDTNPNNSNPYGYTAMNQLGWDYFAGWLDGAPYPIDTTAGGISSKSGDPTKNDGVYSCGYVPTLAQDPVNGADIGACRTVDGKCSVLTLASTGNKGPGRACLESGGILVPKASCQATPPSAMSFALQNGHYSGTLVENYPDGSYKAYFPQDPSGKGRGFRGVTETAAAISWIKSQNGANPWMATVGFAAAHAPFQPPPPSLRSGADLVTGAACDAIPQQRDIMKQFIEAMDTQIGQILVAAGVATTNPDGSINYDAKKSNTVVVVTGDNGSYVNTVNLPFDFVHSKGYVNQTGVWVPLIVSGPMVASPGRKVDSMVNIADLYEFFGELAGLKVRDFVPKNRAVDSYPMLSYLTNANPTAVRSFNFTYGSENLRSPTAIASQGACVIQSANVCTTLMPSASICAMEGGTWYGKGSTEPIMSAYPNGFNNCCDAAAALGNGTTMLPTLQYSVRNANYKLNQMSTPVFTPPAQGTDNTAALAACNSPTPVNQFYKVNQATPTPQIDRPPDSTLKRLANMIGIPTSDSAEQLAYDSLLAELTRIQATVVNCPGDGNFDGVVNQKDLDGYDKWAKTTAGKSSWYDFNLDGLTNSTDRNVIVANLGKTCSTPR